MDESVTWRRFADHPTPCCEPVGKDFRANHRRPSPHEQPPKPIDIQPTGHEQPGRDHKVFDCMDLQSGHQTSPLTGASFLREKIKDSLFPRRSHSDGQNALCVDCGSIGISTSQAWQDPHQVVERPATMHPVIGVWHRMHGCPDRPYARWPEPNVPADPSGSR